VPMEHVLSAHRARFLLASGAAPFRSNRDPLDLIECDLVAGPIIELGCPRAFVRGHLPPARPSSTHRRVRRPRPTIPRYCMSCPIMPTPGLCRVGVIFLGFPSRRGAVVRRNITAPGGRRQATHFGPRDYPPTPDAMLQSRRVLLCATFGPNFCTA
jgi:hypothetical protein